MHQHQGLHSIIHACMDKTPNIMFSYQSQRSDILEQVDEVLCCSTKRSFEDVQILSLKTFQQHITWRIWSTVTQQETSMTRSVSCYPCMGYDS